MNRPLTILQLVGSPTSDFYRELSELYARGSIDALTDPERYRFLIAHVRPDGTWSFPATLNAATIAAAPRHSLAEAIGIITSLAIDAALPQMFCARGMTDMRALLDLIGIPYLGNRPLAMALALDKAKAKAIVAAAGVDVPRSRLVRVSANASAEPLRISLPVVVKPNDADNSDGVALVRSQAEYASALASVAPFSEFALVEEYIELGREVRCGVVERAGDLVCLPLEEYFVDPIERPIRRAQDKLKPAESGGLALVAKTRTESWIVPNTDAIVPAVWEAARRCSVALGCRQYGLFDFRIDPAGRPYFLEAGLYCSFSPQSVVVTMMEAAGVPLKIFFEQAIGALLAAPP